MKKTAQRSKKVKAWAIVIEDFITSDDPVWNKEKSPMAIFRTKEIAEANTLSCDVIPVTITFSLPKKNK